MEFSKGKIRQIRHLMILGALLVLALTYSKEVFQGIAFFFGILSPFLVGGVMAFVLNIPMRAYEEKLFRRWRGKSAAINAGRKGMNWKNNRRGSEAD